MAVQYYDDKLDGSTTSYQAHTILKPQIVTHSVRRTQLGTSKLWDQKFGKLLAPHHELFLNSYIVEILFIQMPCEGAALVASRQK